MKHRVTFPIWVEWGKLTRLLGSGLIAFQAEIARRRATGFSPDDAVTLRWGDLTFDAFVSQHLATLADEAVLCEAIFIQSYALFEAHAKLIRHVMDQGLWRDISDQNLLRWMDDAAGLELKGGFEAWGAQLLRRVGQLPAGDVDWSTAGYDGNPAVSKAGLIEVSVARNLLAHGRAIVTEKAARQCAGALTVGERILLDYARLSNYRGRMKGYAQMLAEGLYHGFNGTHRLGTAWPPPP